MKTLNNQNKVKPQTRCPGFVDVCSFSDARSIALDDSFSPPHMEKHLIELQEASGQDLTTVILFARNAPFFMEGPRHSHIRRRLLDFMGNKALNIWHPTIENTIKDCVDNLSIHPTPDLVVDFSNPVFSIATQTIFGIRPQQPEIFECWIPQLQGILKPLLPLRTILEMQHGFNLLMQQVERGIEGQSSLSPRPLLEELICNPPKDFMRNDIISLVLVLYAASINIAQTLANILRYILLLAPNERKKAKDPAWIDCHLETLLRLNASPKFIHRIAKKRSKVGQYSFVSGDNVLIDLPLIHRDKTNFPAEKITPDAVVPNNSSHIAFGKGIHHCLGASYSRLIVKKVIPCLLTKYPNISLIEQEADYSESSQAVALNSLKCKLN